MERKVSNRCDPRAGSGVQSHPRISFPSASIIDAEPAHSETLLVQRLLMREPSCIALIGQLPFELQWGDIETSMPILKAESLIEFDAVVGKASDKASLLKAPAAVVSLDKLSGKVEQLLGKAVRQFPVSLLVHTLRSNPADAEFFAFGFRRLDVVVNSPIGIHRWYEFSLSDYKKAPDWLNSRFWANPERYDLDDESDANLDWDDEEE